MSRNIQEKDEAWKNERRRYEEQRMKEEIENQRKIKELCEEVQRDNENKAENAIQPEDDE